jgi:ABC-type lipoprotein export system ATPase subunit
MLKMHNVSKVYRTDTVETHALREFSLGVDEGEFLSVTGPSGSGKTTFLNIAGLLEELTRGTYELDGRDISSLNDKERSRVRNEKIGFIFQSFNLIPELDISAISWLQSGRAQAPRRALPRQGRARVTHEAPSGAAVRRTTAACGDRARAGR